MQCVPFVMFGGSRFLRIMIGTPIFSFCACFYAFWDLLVYFLVRANSGDSTCLNSCSHMSQKSSTHLPFFDDLIFLKFEIFISLKLFPVTMIKLT